MQSFGEIMDDLGFNEEASFEAKKAFLKYLFKQADIKQQVREQKAAETMPSKKREPVQLSLFDQDKAS